MPHQSGRGGTITWDVNSEWAPPWNLVIESWFLRYAQRQMETPVMGDLIRSQAWPTVTLGLSEWTANVVYLIPDDFDSGLYGGLAIGLEVTIHLNMNAFDYFFGTGITSIGTVDVPLDGPIRGTMALKGISQLEHISGP